MRLTQSLICKSEAGNPVLRFRLTNSRGAYAELTNRGARLLSVHVPDRQGTLGNVLLTPADVCHDTFYMGATVGRFANRIGGAQIRIGQTTYQLQRNDGENSNHGGLDGYDSKDWQWEACEERGEVIFSRLSPDGEGGFPGNLQCQVTYTWTEQDELLIDYQASTDANTYVNLTNHAYFNLGACGQPVTDHLLWLNADTMLETTPQYIPTGRITAVAGTPFDFTQAKTVGHDLMADDHRLAENRGYNHCYLLPQASAGSLTEAARLTHPQSGRTLQVLTDLPALLVYSAGYLPQPTTGICFEAQYYPDTPSHPHFPSCLLHPGQQYHHRTVYRFGTTDVAQG